MKIDLYLTSEPLVRSQTENKTVLVIDVLRATTTICAALSAGAKAVIPTAGRGEAGELWSKIGSENAILAGEQNGMKIESFQLGNSPYEFTEEMVKGKFVIMSTTNGTPAFQKASGSTSVYCGAVVNVSTVVNEIARLQSDLIIICSGREGLFSLEDTICGGMVIDKLKNEKEISAEINDAGHLALLLYQNNKNNLDKIVSNGEHGRYLASIGFEKDVEFSTKVDSIPVLPVFKNGQLTIENN